MTTRSRTRDRSLLHALLLRAGGAARRARLLLLLLARALLILLAALLTKQLAAVGLRRQLDASQVGQPALRQAERDTACRRVQVGAMAG